MLLIQLVVFVRSGLVVVTHANYTSSKDEINRETCAKMRLIFFFFHLTIFFAMLFWTYTLLKRREVRIEEMNWQSAYINLVIISIVTCDRPAADSSEKKFLLVIDVSTAWTRLQSQVKELVCQSMVLKVCSAETDWSV